MGGEEESREGFCFGPLVNGVAVENNGKEAAGVLGDGCGDTGSFLDLLQ